MIKRIYEHRQGLIEGFTKRYKVSKLVYYETTPSGESALKREKQLKKWKRQRKMKLIEKQNPGWKDLYYELIG